MALSNRLCHCICLLCLAGFSSWRLQPGPVVRAIFRLQKFADMMKIVTREMDLTSGAITLSDPNGTIPSSSSLLPITTDDGFLSRLESNSFNEPTPPPAVLYLQLGKKAVKKIPDNALLGMLVLITTELLQRDLTTKSTILPPVIRDLANSTLGKRRTVKFVFYGALTLPK